MRYKEYVRKETDTMGKDKKEVKSNKIPTSYNEIIYDKYTEYLDAGRNIKACCPSSFTSLYFTLN